MPVDTEDNDLPVDMTTLEKVSYALHPGSLSPNDEFASNTPRLSRWRQSLLEDIRSSRVHLVSIEAIGPRRLQAL
ncbi:hypothetical protein [Methylocapsa acidiphila]|uniref:hypothetical protein n=1 Tax=Methylocapsa acidiphila TaxID=133552 RepID=UPI00047A840E|nr:hypothetical protein [Methylocapsa acidiphila]